MNQPSTSATPLHEDIVLTAADVERLLHDDSSESRSGILEKISRNYNSEQFKGREREIAEHVFRLLMKDVAVRVREALADRIKGNTTVPRDIILHLANDVETVAIPVLRDSKVLSDADLVNIVEQSHDMGKLVAIAEREEVSSRVSDALVETHYAQVMTTLLGNEGAAISDRSLERIADDFRGDAGVMEALVGKPRLPITVVERIITKASDAVAAKLKQLYKLNDQDAKRDSNFVREDFMVRLMSHELSIDEVEALVAQMAKEGRLTPSIVMTALCRGQLLFFIVALAHFSGIPTANAKRLLDDRGEHGFDGLYKKSELPESMMDAIRLLLRSVQDMATDDAPAGSPLYANRLAERVILTAGNQQIEYLPYFIALVRQNANR